MKKLFFVLIFIFLSISLFSLDIFGQWTATFETFEMNEESGEEELVSKNIEVEFLDTECIFHYEDRRSERYPYKLEDDFLFIGDGGYWFEEINENIFKIVPAFEGGIEEIIFRRGE